MAAYYAVPIINNESLVELIPALRARIISLAKISTDLAYLDAVRGNAYDHLTGMEELIDDLECAFEIEEDLKELKTMLTNAINATIQTLDIETEEPQDLPANSGSPNEPVNVT